MNIRRAKRIISLAAALACTAASGLPVAAADSSAHEPITMLIAYQSGDEFLSLLHEKYPEIDLQFVAYNGTNTTEFLNEILAAGEMTDIYMKTYYSPQQEDLSDRLLDLSGYAFTDKYAQARIREISDEGAIYLLPFFYSCIGITYNETLLEENGWTLPTSFKELEELAPKVKEAGYNLCLNQIQYPGYGFQYLCNIADTGYLSTLPGRKWQADFLSGKVSLSGSQEMLDCMAMLQRWRDVGMLNCDGDPYDDEKTRERMAQGDTLFMLGSSNGIADADSEYTFKLMPYLSENGDQNAYVLQTARYYGLNKKLGEAGNEQKLEDALHVLDVFSTQEGMNALMGSDRQNSSLLPLKDYEISEDNYYYNIKDEIDVGYTAPLLYSGWENVLADVGNRMFSFMRGESTLDYVIAGFDDGQAAIVNDAPETFTIITEKIDQADCARLVGTCLGEAAGADLALVSLNRYIAGAPGAHNNDGVSGFLVPYRVTDYTITVVFPTGWNGTIKTVTLTGARIRELMESGYDKYGTGETYPYVMSAPEGFALEDDMTYKVAICGATDEVKREGDIQDSGIVGMDAAKEYFSRFDTFSAKDIDWK